MANVDWFVLDLREEELDLFLLIETNDIVCS